MNARSGKKVSLRMNAKRMLMIVTLAMMLTVAGGMRGGEASASGLTPKSDTYGDCSPTGLSSSSSSRTQEKSAADAKDSFLTRLGAGSEEEVWEALHGGLSLADIAAVHGREVEPLIDDQVAELTEQLKQRLLSGNLTLEQYKALKAEVPSLITDSAYGLTV
jgi:hypothetical protein